MKMTVLSLFNSQYRVVFVVFAKLRFFTTEYTYKKYMYTGEV
jgi:hypothetical protein